MGYKLKMVKRCGKYDRLVKLNMAASVCGEYDKVWKMRYVIRELIHYPQGQYGSMFGGWMVGCFVAVK